MQLSSEVKHLGLFLDKGLTWKAQLTNVMKAAYRALWTCKGTFGILHLKRDSTRAETRFGLSAKWMSLFKSAGKSVQLTTGSRGVRISGSNGSNAG